MVAPYQIQVRHRPGTQDATIFQEVLGWNEYRFPAQFRSTDFILDIGAHIGIASLACLLRGAGFVWAVEPDADNYHLLRENVGGFPGVKTFHGAVWYNNSPVFFSGYPEGLNACGTVVPGATVSGVHCRLPVFTLTLDEIIGKAVEEGHKKVRLMKIDCEGAEYPILFGASLLSYVDEIVGESHDIPGDWPEKARVNGFDHYHTTGLIEYLKNQGYDVAWRWACRIGRRAIFHAKRKGIV